MLEILVQFDEMLQQATSMPPVKGAERKKRNISGNVDGL